MGKHPPSSSVCLSGSPRNKLGESGLGRREEYTSRAVFLHDAGTRSERKKIWLDDEPPMTYAYVDW